MFKDHLQEASMADDILIADELPSRAEQKMMVILYRARHIYCHDPIESTAQFLFPRVPDDDIPGELELEWRLARSWWRQLDPEEQHALTSRYEQAVV